MNAKYFLYNLLFGDTIPENKDYVFGIIELACSNF